MRKRGCEENAFIKITITFVFMHFDIVLGAQVEAKPFEQMSMRRF